MSCVDGTGDIEFADLLQVQLIPQNWVSQFFAGSSDAGVVTFCF